MNINQLTAIRARNEARRQRKAAATPGDWHWCLGSGTNMGTGIAADPLPHEIETQSRLEPRFVCDVLPDYKLTDDESWNFRQENMDFILGAKNDPVEDDIDALLAYIADLEARS